MARRQKTCPIEASNLANFGTDLEKNIKRAAAECERAWDGAGQQQGIRIWRIEKFKIVEWPRDQIGKFYNGDSYIILHSYHTGPNSPLKHDIHFWLGKFTSQDEAGTAAYKTVELDDRLGGAPVQHREVQGHESDLFIGYFPERTIELLEGGIESGFHHVEAVQYPTRLLHVKGNRQNVRITQCALSCESLNSGDVFILDLGMEVIQWNGKQSSLFEKMKAGQMVRAIKDERGGQPQCFIYEEGDKEKGLDKFWAALAGNPKNIKSAKQGGDDNAAAREASSQVKLFRLSDRSGSLSIALEKTGNIAKNDLDTNDTFILDNGAEIFVWIGKRASANEKKMGMQHAEQYLQNNNRPPFTPISRVVEGGENTVFDLNFNGGELSRGLDLDAPESGHASCCPHYPEGTHKWDAVQNQNQPSSANQFYRQTHQGGQPNAAQVNQISTNAFSFFQNRERMDNASGSGNLYKF